MISGFKKSKVAEKIVSAKRLMSSFNSLGQVGKPET